MACASSESGRAVVRRANALRTHDGGSGVDGLATSARCASSTAFTTIDGPSEALGHASMIVGAEAAIGVGEAFAGDADGAQPVAAKRAVDPSVMASSVRCE